MALLRSVLDAGVPYFGICFGNQLFGRALGFGTYKLGYGHRGINQPVMDLSHPPGRDHRAQPRVRGRRPARRAAPGRRTAGPGSATSGSTTTWSRAWRCEDDDGALLSFSVQYHPEAAAGPHDASYLFDRFVELMSARAKTLRQAKGTVA